MAYSVRAMLMAILFGAVTALREAGKDDVQQVGNLASGLNHTSGLQKGESCDCSGGKLSQNTCCGAGLICSVSEKICKPAIGGACTYKLIGTECAKGTYGGGHDGIECKKGRCCVSGPGMMGATPEVALANFQPINEDPDSCCSGEIDFAPHSWFGGGASDVANNVDFCA